jgi:DNA-binding MarR family transcriptional regulator
MGKDQTNQQASSDPDLAAIEQAVVTIRRSQTRRVLARLARRRSARDASAGRVRDPVIQLLDAIEAATARGRPPTVTEAASALGVDQPRASRLAAQALEAGLLTRGADQADGRRSLLLLTQAGRAVLDQIHAFRRHVIGEALADWDDTDRAALARLLTRFVASLTKITQELLAAGDRASPRMITQRDHVGARQAACTRRSARPRNGQLGRRFSARTGCSVATAGLGGDHRHVLYGAMALSRRRMCCWEGQSGALNQPLAIAARVVMQAGEECLHTMRSLGT